MTQFSPQAEDGTPIYVFGGVAAAVLALGLCFAACKARSKSKYSRFAGDERVAELNMRGRGDGLELNRIDIF